MIKSEYKLISIDHVYPSGHYMDNDHYKNMALQRSIRLYGQMKPIILDATFKIIKGNRLFAALLEEGHKKALCCIYQTTNEIDILDIRLSLEESFSDQNTLKLAGEIKRLVDKYTPEEIIKKLCLTPSDIYNYLNLFEFKWQEKTVTAKQNTLF